MKKHTQISLLSLLPLFLSSLTANATEGKLPFLPGEKLTYELWWAFIPVGETTLEVKPFTTHEGKKVWHFSMESKSNSFLDAIFKVRDFISSYVDEEMNRTVRYKQDQLEGSFRRDILVEFDWEKNQAIFSNFDKTDPPLDIMEDSFDPLSIIYKFRTFDIALGKDERAPVTDGKKSIMGIARVLKKEKLELNKMKFEAFLVEPEMKHIGGIFKKEKKAKIKVWFTTDEKHYPVKVESKVSIGSFVGIIKSIEEGSPAQLESAEVLP